MYQINPKMENQQFYMESNYLIVFGKQIQWLHTFWGTKDERQQWISLYHPVFVRTSYYYYQLWGLLKPFESYLPRQMCNNEHSE